jgi:magnesium transporter
VTCDYTTTLLINLISQGADSILEVISKRILGGREEMEDSVFGSRHRRDEPPTLSTHSKKKFPSRGSKSKTKDTNRSDSGVSDATSEAITDQSDEDTVGDEWDELAGRDWIEMPFELKAVDAVLHTVSAMLSEDVEILQEAVYDAIDDVVMSGRAVGDQSQHVLRALKNEIKEMSSRVDNFVRAINDTLDDLEDLSLMNLSRLITHPERFIQPVPEEVLNEESDEVRICILSIKREMHFRRDF